MPIGSKELAGLSVRHSFENHFLIIGRNEHGVRRVSRIRTIGVLGVHRVTSDVANPFLFAEHAFFEPNGGSERFGGPARHYAIWVFQILELPAAESAVVLILRGARVGILRRNVASCEYRNCCEG